MSQKPIGMTPPRQPSGPEQNAVRHIQMVNASLNDVQQDLALLVEHYEGQLAELRAKVKGLQAQVDALKNFEHPVLDNPKAADIPNATEGMAKLADAGGQQA